MSKLIDRQEVLKVIRETPYIGLMEKEALLDAVKGMHAVEERKKGMWLDSGDYCVCNQCWHTEQQFNGVEPIPRHTPFCAMCGADMREEKTNA